MRIVLDTNVLVASFIARGVCRDLVEHCIRRHQLVTSEFILGELERTLVHKFGATELEAQEATGLMRSRMEAVIPAVLPTPVARDQSDDAVLGTALAGAAACVVTGDKDLLVLERFGSIDILKPSEFAAYEAARTSE